MNKLFIIVLALVGLFVESRNANSQSLKSGVYDIGLIAINSDKLITGYIEDGIGDEDFGSAERTCLLYFQGTLSSESDTSYIFLKDVYQTKESANYKGILYPNTFMKGSFNVEFDSVPNTGICSTSTFDKDNNKYKLSLLLVEGKNWQQIALIQKDVSVYDRCETDDRTIVEALSKFDVVKIQSSYNNCLRIELEDNVYGYIKVDGIFYKNSK